MIERAPTGIPLLDRMLEGGFPRPSSVLISGNIGTNKNTFAQQILWHGLRRGERCIYVTVDAFPRDIIENMEKYGWRVSEYVRSGSLVFIDCFSPRVGITSEAKYVVEDPFNIDELLEVLAIAEEELYGDGSVGRLVFSHISTILFRLGKDDIFRLMSRLHAEARKYNGVYMLVYTEGVLDPRYEVFIRQMPDVVIRLRRSWRGQQAVRLLWVERCIKTIYSRDRYPYYQTPRGIVVGDER